MKKEYEIGDYAWIYFGNHNRVKTKSKVVHSFELYSGKKYYVCEIDTPVDPVLEIRDYFTMAASEDAGIGLQEAIKSVTKKIKGEFNDD